ncbi:ExeM/NucH family extracellular endonuclease [Verticiella sediminum]|uniref:ExeM/NucH family extracellular endonuclease n=1 Tax=Verticiella sediminum TaxID=1247510 RepID=A0A556AJG3_9BURK|nr:ExeM/NucH family extracellular endonuclease [Verticiella sediminum]TSH93021.1 ExeM/NucH family extracellular endonuclease [Verticiella sediminum]
MSVRINEFHYDNAGADLDESVEIAGTAGTDLAGWGRVLDNGNDGKFYSTLAPSGALADGGEGPAPLTQIHAIQGAGAASPLVGQQVTLQAIVVGDFQNGDADDGRNLGGFFLQAETAEHDDDAATSEGIFVYAAALDVDVQLGDKVMVTGTVSEYFGKTQVTATQVDVVQAGAVADVDSMAVAVDFPSLAVNEIEPGVYQPDLSAYEGMLVRFNETLTLTEQYDLDRYNEVKLAAGERPTQYTVDNVPDAQGYDAHLRDLAQRTITYDDGLSAQNQPIGYLDGYADYATANAPRMGDTIDGLTGVLDYAHDAWRVRSVEDGDNTFERVNLREDAPADVGGTLKLAGLNVLNYFRTIDQDTASTVNGFDPRGADSQAEFDRQTAKLVNVLKGMDADVVGLVELENDFLPGSPGNAIEYLVAQLNAALPEQDHYAWVDPGRQHVGGDAIGVGFIYKTSAVRIAEGTEPAILNDAALAQMEGGDALLAQSTVGGIFDGENTSRNPLAVTFEEIASGESFTAALNHFKSKGSGPDSGADADQVDGAGAWNQQRELAAQAVAQWLESDPTGSVDEDIFVLGDLNAYAMEGPLALLAAAGYTNLEDLLDDPYSYVFDGQKGSLDYILSSATALAQVTGVTQWHINADEADALDYNLDYGRDPAIFDAGAMARVSDHDPVLVGLDLGESNEDEVFVLQLLHFSDAEAGLLAGQTAPYLGALIDWFDDEYVNTLVLSGGDNFIPGPFMTAGADPSLAAVIGAAGAGRPDIAILNALGVDASAVGNHEWDLGSSVLADAVTPSGDYAGALFPYLSANLDYSADSAINALTADGGQALGAVAGKFVPSAVIEQSGETIGLVGATTQMLERISSPTGTEVAGFPTAGQPGDGQEQDDMALLAEQLQLEIDALVERGVNKIILLSHLQELGNEKALAGLLEGVDIILAAGSHTAMGDADDTAFPGRAFAEGYPYLAQGADGGDTLIVSTDGEYTYLGRLVVEFDAEGRLLLESLDEAINGAYSATQDTVESVYGADIDAAFAEGSIGGTVREITEAVDALIAGKDGTVYGYSSVFLEGDRTFGRTQETNLGNLTADANAWAAQAAADDGFIVSLKNGGGIRASIGAVDPATGDKTGNIANPAAGKEAGGISQLDIENALRFDNKLAVFDTTPEGLLAILNYGAGLNPGNGGYPQVGGVSFSYDPALPAGQRVQDVALVDAEGNKLALYDDGQLVAGAPATISVVTLNFTAQDGDGYPIQANATNFRFVLEDGTLSEPVAWDDLTTDVPDNVMGEQHALANYLGQFHATPETAYGEADTAAAQDERIQNLSVREDSVLEGTDGQPGEPGTPEPIVGGDGGETLVGTDGDDDIRGGAGNDILHGGGGDDRLDGGAGLDHARFDGDAAAYDITLGENGLPASVSGPTGSSVLIDVERLMFDDKILAFDLDDAPGQVHRMYEAALDRAPDIEGISYWVRDMDASGNLLSLARSFLGSDEFAAANGNVADVSHADFVDMLYGTVLDRDADTAGGAYWVQQLEAGMARDALLGLFSESIEHRATVDAALTGGVELELAFFA